MNLKRLCLIILDGWGINEREEGNAISIASTPNIDSYYKSYPWTELATSGAAVGLPEGQMGNSEVGHITMGSGRVVDQELTRITKTIKDGSLARNPVLLELLRKVRKAGGRLHLAGLLSDGGVHSHEDHLYALIDIAAGQGVKDIRVHAILDGRDTPPKSGLGYVKKLTARLKQSGAGKVATVSGRYYAMDRDKRWERVELAYEAMVSGKGEAAADAVRAVEDSYARDITDEFMIPTIIEDDFQPISDGDALLFFNFRADRAREIVSAFAVEDFDGFKREALPKLSAMATMTPYEKGLGVPVLFSPEDLKNILGEVLSYEGVKQFRVSETEKYAHITFFFNGGIEEPFEGEDRLVIPSIKDAATYDLVPHMRSLEIAMAAVERITRGEHSFLLLNIANGDMVGHTGNLEAAVKACEAVDMAVGKVTGTAMREGWSVIITSDHGNVEQMICHRTGAPFTAHMSSKVPFIIIDKDLVGVKLREHGGLRDVAPTVLKLMGLEVPAEMTGKALY
ncbi:MAG: 2,3-bisphosphoglycerate-independent phosphoglycerate mutase [Thermodesulfobacteriota bacterium]